MNFYRFKQDMLNNYEMFEKSLESTAENELPAPDNNFRISSDTGTNTKNLINLIKKQKIVNDALEREFK